MFPQEERLFMIKNIKAVKDAYINEESGVIDYLPTLDKVKPDVFVVNAEGGSDEKRRICAERGIEYVELQRTPYEGLKARSSSDLKKALSATSDNMAQDAGIPTRLDLAGIWIDQPYVSQYHPGWAITISLEPTFDIRDRCGLSTSTRNMIRKIWPVKLPKMDPEMLARLGSFHGTAFSVNFMKEFVVVSPDKFNSRITNLLTLLKIENRQVISIKNDISILEKLDYENIHRILENKRIKSLQILKLMIN